ncbi:MAG: GNAT family N-acetyltransferase [Gemmatimonadaceae bacterium]
MRPARAFHVRAGRGEDAPAIRALYQAVGATPGGIARRPDEVTTDYVNDFVAHSLARGIIIVAEFPDSTRLAAELHAYRSDLQVLKHVMGDLTIAVHPDAQGQGLGRRMFVELLDEVKSKHPDVTRVELITQESNTRAQRLYESVGFRREGWLPGRIVGPSGQKEADIPMAWLRDSDRLRSE